MLVTATQSSSARRRMVSASAPCSSTIRPATSTTSSAVMGRVPTVLTGSEPWEQREVVAGDPVPPDLLQAGPLRLEVGGRAALAELAEVRRRGADLLRERRQRLDVEAEDLGRVEPEHLAGLADRDVEERLHQPLVRV